jgi:ribosomal-protein-alanine N-acetyltransferase
MVSEISVQSASIRTATADDVLAIRTIDAKVYPKPWSSKMVHAQISGPNRLHLVAEVDGVVFGHAGILFLDDVGHVSTVAVDPSMQRRRIGFELMLTLLRSAFENNCSAVTLEVRSGNTAAMSMYRQFAMAPTGVRRGYYADTGDDALILWSPTLDASYARRLGNLESAVMGDE